MLCLTSAGFAQQSPAPAAQQDSSRPQLSQRPAPNPETPKGKIKIDVVVTDAAGHPVAGLQQQDFTLLDDKKPQPILSFRRSMARTGDGTEPDEPPVEVILLVDEANNLLHNIAYERYQIDRFLGRTEAGWRSR